VTSVLLLAGTAEAAALAGRLQAEPGITVTASLAGRVAAPRALPCPVRVGGFGGVDGLVAELGAAGPDLVVDATHPFAARLSANAAAAADRLGRPRLRLLRPPWTPGPGDDWHEVDDLAGAADRLVTLDAATVLLATGRHHVAPFARAVGTRFVLRSIDPPGPLPLAEVTVVLGRGPFSVESEQALLVAHGIDAVVTRNSGGTGAAAKLTAARDLGLPVIMVRRPPPPPGPVVATVDEAVGWVRARRSGS
jgi:precorrin-6A/cobalt-precorrin-6A reductase